MIFTDFDPVRFDAVVSRNEEGDRFSEDEGEQNGKHGTAAASSARCLMDEDRDEELRWLVFGFVILPAGCGYRGSLGYPE